MVFKHRLLLLVGVVMLFTAGCAGAGQPEDAVMTYLEALVAKDDDAYFGSVCPDWEAQARVEKDAYWAVGAELVDVLCTADGEEGSLTRIVCEGAIALDYNGEIREISLDNFTYLVQEIDGEWKMCGYR